MTDTSHIHSSSAPYSAAPTTGLGAGPWRRLAAYLVDTLVLALLLTALLSILGIDVAEGSTLVATITSVVIFAFLSYFQTTEGQTPGKRLLKIRATTLDGQRLNLQQAATRNVWILAGIIPVVGSVITLVIGVAIFVMAFLDDKSQGLNDRWAKTRVLKK